MEAGGHPPRPPAPGSRLRGCCLPGSGWGGSGLPCVEHGGHSSRCALEGVPGARAGACPSFLSVCGGDPAGCRWHLALTPSVLGEAIDPRLPASNSVPEPRMERKGGRRAQPRCCDVAVPVPQRDGAGGVMSVGSSPATPCSWELWAHVQAPREPSGPRPGARLLGLPTAAYSPCPPLARVCDLIRFS